MVFARTEGVAEGGGGGERIVDMHTWWRRMEAGKTDEIGMLFGDGWGCTVGVEAVWWRSGG